MSLEQIKENHPDQPLLSAADEAPSSLCIYSPFCYDQYTKIMQSMYVLHDIQEMNRAGEVVWTTHLFPFHTH